MEKCATKKFSLSPPSRRKRRGENARERSKESLQLDCRTLLPSSGTFLFDGDEQSRKSAHAFGRPDNILNDHRMMNFFFEIYFLKKWAILGNFFVQFGPMSNKRCKFYIKFLCKYPSSLWCQESNSRPSEYESPPSTTRPGLAPYLWVPSFQPIKTSTCLNSFPSTRIRCTAVPGLYYTSLVIYSMQQIIVVDGTRSPYIFGQS